MEPIAAIATPFARGAIGILRLSGDGVIPLVSALFRPVSGGALEHAPDRKLVYGDFCDADGAVIDRCLATVSRAPNSYTGEDTAELQCHGAPLVLTRGLETLLQAGARAARPGEFTKRAFLNGRMDLTQAEAVIDLIDAETDAAARNASAQLAGAIRRRVADIYDSLLDVTARFHVLLDDPDADVSPLEDRDLMRTMSSASAALRALSGSFQRGRLMTEGIATAIIGRPNVGKSSLLNALLGYERAIVSPLPGTTRDTVEERALFGDRLLRLIDTAGLRKTQDPIEQLGTARTRAAMARADLVLVVLDASRPIGGEDELVLQAASKHAAAIVVRNKSDLPTAWEESALSGRFPRICTVSAQRQLGLELLASQVQSLFPRDVLTAPGEILTNARQADAARRAEEALSASISDLNAGMTPDAVLTGIEDALAALGEITGETLQDALVTRIFERFCVGK